MSTKVPTQLIVGLGILLVGGGIVGGEYLLVRWYPRHIEAVKAETLKPIAYKNDALGIEMQVAAGFFGKVESFAGGVRIIRPKFWSIGPSITITSQPNPDQSVAFTEQVLAKWETLGVTEDLPRFHFEHTRLDNRDAVLIWQYKDRAMLLTARVISPDRLVEVNCTPGRADEDLFVQACDASLRTIKVAGPASPPPAPAEVLELAPVQHPRRKR